ncbi:MAG: ABC transporter ATP-binding protein/permease, partial [Holophagales bacterium]|nr:ABC transporter ATP-binding protein/permease [Holophagales bacterium]
LRSLAGIGFIATLTSGAHRVATGTQSLGATEAAAMAQLRLLSSIARIGVSLESFQKTATALTRIARTLEARPTVVDGPLVLAPSEGRGEMVLDRVVFGYDPSSPVLRSLSMHVPAGATIGIVGASGAGKSTVLRLLMRFWDPQHGRILLDGTDIRSYDLSSLRRCLAVVPQQITLFQGTLRENIAYGRRGAELEEVVAAAKIAEVHDLVDALPNGYDTPLGFGGMTLSGGQRQRLAIARAVLADRPILLFDEATSSLDHATEAAVQRSLADATRGRTTIVVAHRLSTVRHADRIYVLEDGVVQEQGRHDELVASDGFYAAMWRVQTGER